MPLELDLVDVLVVLMVAGAVLYTFGWGNVL